MKSILLIGLGRFGRYIAEKLHDMQHDVLAVDHDEDRVNRILPLVTNALIADTYACLMFGDGTTYASGALYGRHIVNDGKPVAFRLPKLPQGFAYTAFAVSGTTMYAAWEESDFYKTGKSGFLSVDLDAILYGSVSDAAR